ncbi:mitochondrial carrier protein-like protein [Peziza echinospora]|nr:mitochondrial carrier protein-like protein [Peziza echinospora]
MEKDATRAPDPKEKFPRWKSFAADIDPRLVKPKSSSTPQKSLRMKDIVIASAFTAFLVDLLFYPLDTIKTRVQSKEYKTVYAGNRAVMFRGLYQGIGTVIIATIPSSMAFFTTYEGSKSLLGQHLTPGLPQPIIHCLSSSLAELISCAFLTPSEVIKQNAQTFKTPPTSSSSSSFSKNSNGNGKVLLKKSSFAGFTLPTSTSLQALKLFTSRPKDLFRGYFVLTGRNLPSTAIHFPIYEALKTRWGVDRRVAGEGDVGRTVRVTAMAGAVAGAIAAVVTTPIDVVKTRVMLDSKVERKEGEGGGGRGRGRGGRYTEVVREILQESGQRGMWRGVVLRGSWAGLGVGVYLGAYEGAKVWLKGPEEGLEVMYICKLL